MAIVIYMVLFLVAHCQTTILRLGCGSYAHFGVIETNRKLPGPFLTLYGPDTEWCKLQCVAHPSCKSISFSEEGVCELNNKTANDHTSKITTIYHEKWTYYTTHYNDPFVGTNCKNSYNCHSKCIDTCECPGYKCYDVVTYTVIETKKTWIKAREYCLGHGGDLVSIHNYDEEKFIRSILLRQQLATLFWIGFNDIQVENSFHWSDGTYSDYQRWSSGEPNNMNNEDCAALYFDGFQSAWNDYPCSYTFFSICKFFKVS